MLGLATTKVANGASGQSWQRPILWAVSLCYAEYTKQIYDAASPGSPQDAPVNSDSPRAIKYKLSNAPIPNVCCQR